MDELQFVVEMLKNQRGDEAAVILRSSIQPDRIYAFVSASGGDIAMFAKLWKNLNFALEQIEDPKGSLDLAEMVLRTTINSLK